MKLHTGSCNGFFLFVGVVVLVSFCQSAVCSSFSSSGPHGAQSQQQQQHWRKLLQLVEQERPYNGSVVLGTYPQLNGTGAGLRKLLPAVSGYVPKAGSAEALTWSQKPHYAVAREAIFLNWRQQEMTNPAPQLYAGQQPTCAAARHPPVPFHHCHVFVNHQYKVAYIRSPKSASTSIMNWMGQCRYNKTRNWNSTTCLNYSWERYQTPQQIASIWKDYFFFGFIRNPWARAYSLYKDMTGTNHFLHKHGPRCQLEWGKFCRDPFAEFDRLYGGGCSHKQPHYAYWHMMDQYHCMITPTGEWAVDFLGRVERGNEDWKVVVQEMNKRRLPGVPEVPFSALDHVHKVAEPAQQPPPEAPQQPQPQPQQPQPQPQQPQPQPQHVRPIRQLLGSQVMPAAQQQQLQQQQQKTGTAQPLQMLRLFRHLWRRIRVATAAANEDDAEADGEVEDFAAGTAGATSGVDKEGLMGPYSGSNEHCIDAVSQWFACDIEKFGYLSPAAAAAAAASGPADATQTPLPAVAQASAANTVAARNSSVLSDPQPQRHEAVQQQL